MSSPATTTAIAIIAVVATFITYLLRRRGFKRDAANIILLELKAAETKLKDAQKTYRAAQQSSPSYIDFPTKLRLMNSKSWTKYKYLFVRNFEPEQWSDINEFYANCKNYDEALEHKDSTFRFNESEIRSNIQKNIADYARILADETMKDPHSAKDSQFNVELQEKSIRT